MIGPDCLENYLQQQSTTVTIDHIILILQISADGLTLLPPG